MGEWVLFQILCYDLILTQQSLITKLNWDARKQQVKQRPSPTKIRLIWINRGMSFVLAFSSSIWQRLWSSPLTTSFFLRIKPLQKTPMECSALSIPLRMGKKNPSRPPDHALLFLFANTTEKNICITIFQRITSKEKGGCKSTCIERRTKGLSNPFKKQGSKLKRKKREKEYKKGSNCRHKRISRWTM